MQNKITIEELKRFDEIENQLYEMGVEFMKTLREVTPDGIDIWDMPRYRAEVDDVGFNGRDKIHIKFTNSYDSSDFSSFLVDAESFLEDPKECAKRFSEERTKHVLNLKEIAKENLKKFELKEYERIKTKYGL